MLLIQCPHPPCLRTTVDLRCHTLWHVCGVALVVTFCCGCREEYVVDLRDKPRRYTVMYSAGFLVEVFCLLMVVERC